jgi:uncharacterized protein (TIGR04255 family)
MYIEVYFEPGSFAPPRFFDLVPKLKDIGFADVEFGNVGRVRIDPLEGSLEGGTIPRIRCWSVDRKRLVQLSPDTVFVNLVNIVGEYPGWDEFHSLFCSVNEAVQSTVGRPRIDTLSLNTIDELRVPLSNFVVGKYLDCGGKRIPAWYADTKEAFDIILRKGVLKTDGFNRLLNVAGRPSTDVFLLRILSEFHNVRGETRVEELLSTLHEESNESFESLLTKTTRDEVMGGVSEYANHG